MIRCEIYFEGRLACVFFLQTYESDSCVNGWANNGIPFKVKMMRVLAVKRALAILDKNVFDTELQPKVTKIDGGVVEFNDGTRKCQHASGCACEY